MILQRIKYFLTYNERGRFYLVLLIVFLFHFIIVMYKSHNEQLLLAANKSNKVMLSFNLQSSAPGRFSRQNNRTNQFQENIQVKKDGVYFFDKKHIIKDSESKNNSKLQTPSISMDEIKKIELNYKHKIRKQIEDSKYYPTSARRRNLECKIKVQFVLKKSGNIGKIIEILKPSEYEILNNAAQETIKRAAPFPPFPEYIDYEEMVLPVYIRYTLDE